MDVVAIQAELERRLSRVVEQTYPNPQAAALFPCAIVNFPTITAFHVDNAHSITRSSWSIEMHAGRGDTNDALAQLSRWLSDGDESVKAVLEDRTTPRPWVRLALQDTQALDTNAESLSITINIEIDS